MTSEDHEQQPKNPFASGPRWGLEGCDISNFLEFFAIFRGLGPNSSVKQPAD